LPPLVAHHDNQSDVTPLKLCEGCIKEWYNLIVSPDHRTWCACTLPDSGHAVVWYEVHWHQIVHQHREHPALVISIRGRGLSFPCVIHLSAEDRCEVGDRYVTNGLSKQGHTTERPEAWLIVFLSCIRQRIELSGSQVFFDCCFKSHQATLWHRRVDRPCRSPYART